MGSGRCCSRKSPRLTMPALWSWIPSTSGKRTSSPTAIGPREVSQGSRPMTTTSFIERPCRNAGAPTYGTPQREEHLRRPAHVAEHLHRARPSTQPVDVPLRADGHLVGLIHRHDTPCLLYTSPSPRDRQ